VTLYYAVNDQDAVFLLSNRPSADAIYDALKAIRLPSGVFWVGPVPRIVRDNTITTWSTTVTWVFAVPAPYSQDAASTIARQVASLVTDALVRVESDFVEATVEPYTEAKYGPLSGWDSGLAAQPRDDNTPIKLAEQAGDHVRAVGTYIENAASGIGSSIQSTAMSVQNTARTILIAGGIALGLIVIVKVWRTV
jgi:predicted small secreted protein